MILNGDGSVTLVLGTVDLSATRTSLAMVAAESLGLELDDVRVVIGDTDMVAHSDASAGDKVTYVTSKSVDAACLDLVGKLKRRIARMHFSRRSLGVLGPQANQGSWRRRSRGSRYATAVPLWGLEGSARPSAMWP